MSDQPTAAEPVLHLANLDRAVETLSDLATRASTATEGGFRQELGHLLAEGFDAIAGALRSVHALHGGESPAVLSDAPTTAAPSASART